MWPELREVMSSCAHIGTPATDLRKRLGLKAAARDTKAMECLKNLPQVWWTVSPDSKATTPSSDMIEEFEDNPNAFAKACEEGLVARVLAILRRLDSMKETHVTLVAHCRLIGALTGALGIQTEKCYEHGKDNNRGGGSKGKRGGHRRGVVRRPGRWLRQGAVETISDIDIQAALQRSPEELSIEEPDLSRTLHTSASYHSSRMQLR